MSRFGTPTLITRGTNDVQQVQMVYMMMLNFMVTAPIMSIGGIIMAVREDAGMSWLVWVSVAVLLGTISVIISRLMPLFRSMQDKLDSINGTLREQITGIRVVRAFVREAYESERFTEKIKTSPACPEHRPAFRGDVPAHYGDPQRGHGRGPVVWRPPRG